MSLHTLFSLILVTAGAGLLGFSLSRQLAGTRSGRQVASDWLVGLGAMAAGAAMVVVGTAGEGLTGVAIALLVGGMIVDGRKDKRRDPQGR